MILSQAIEAFLLDKRVQGCSPNTIRNYRLDLQRLADYLETDPELTDISTVQLIDFIDYMMTSRIKPKGVAPRPERLLSAKTIQNLHTTLCSLWTWAVAEGYATDHLPRQVNIGRPSRPVIEPLSREQIQALLDCTSHSQTWERLPETATELPKMRQMRDKALILFLLDTGVRASELCSLSVGLTDLIGGTARVRSKGRLDSGEGKPRIVRFSPTTARALRRYLSERKVLERMDDPLFCDRYGRHFDRRYLNQHLHRLGRRAGIPDLHTHRFRHTFAINYLRNGGDVYTLQELLGHTTLEMVKRYLRLAEVDIENAHRRASPVENWRL